MKNRSLTTIVLAGLAGLGLACPGSLGESFGDPPRETLEGTPPEQTLDDRCLEPSTGVAPLRRLTNTEYRYTAGDLLGLPDLAAEVASSFPAETESLGFRNNAAFLDVPLVLAQQYMLAAERLSQAAVADLSGLVPCQGAVDEGCAADFITQFGLRAFRRPLEPGEIDAYLRLYEKGSADYGPEKGIEWVLFAMLQSPSFLYRVELPAGDGDPISRISPYETATRLSYLLWHSMPDDALLSAAADGRLSTPEQIEAEARRMLEDPKARRIFHFFEEWLDVHKVNNLARDPGLFPEYGTELAGLLHEETRRFVDHVVFDLDGRLETLLTAPFTFVNRRLAEHYGFEGPEGESFEKVYLDVAERAGLFTQGAVLAVHDMPTRTSIVRRGLKMRIDLLCHTVGAPPDDVALDLPPIDGSMSQAEMLAIHRETQSCAACHDLIDPLGVPFESFDALGRWRTEDEGGLPVFTESELTATRDADGPVAGPVEMIHRLARSNTVRDCVTTQMFRYAYGRGETAADSCAQAQLRDQFSRDDDLRELLIALTQTDAFLYRQSTGE
jgi:hypothetical protein